MPIRFKMTMIYNLSKRLLMLSFIVIMNLYKSSIRLLIAASSPFTSRISLCMRSSSLKRKAKGSALYTNSSFFSVSGAMAKFYFKGLSAVKEKKGLTLVEVLIAMVILLLVSLALMQTALVSIDANMRNVLRDEAVSVAEMRMDEARNTAFDSLASDSTPLPSGVDCPATFTDGSANGQRIQRNIRNVSNKDF